MHNILLASLFSILIANLLRYYSQKEVLFLSLFAGNYFLASFFALLTGSFSLNISQSDFLPWSIVMGILFIICFLLYKSNIVHNGVSLSVSVMRISLIIPSLLSVIVFKENLNIYSSLAIILIITAISLLTHAQKNRNIILLILLFIATGFSDFILKIKDSLLQVSNSTFLFFMFLSALCTTLVLMLFKKEKFDRKSFFHGIIIGFPNYLTTFFFMKSLQTLPAVISYPLNSSLIVFGSFITDRFIWKNQFTFRQVVLYLCLLAGIILLNISLFN